MIELERITKSFDDKIAVDSVNLVVPRASVFGLIGPNGAGKTTTLKMIATLMKPDRGAIAVRGLDVSREAPAVRRIIGYMPDAFGTFRSVTCEEYLEFFGRSYGYYGTRLHHQIDGVLELTDLGSVRDEVTTALSTGMLQRLSLAKTLLHDPEVLILDEPASGLDPRARIEIRSLLKELGRMGKTVIVSSHILADLEEICSVVAIMEVGRVIWTGSLQEVRQRHRTEHFNVVLEVGPQDLKRAAELLQTLDVIEEAKVREEKIEAKMAGHHANDVLKALIDAGVEIRAFSEEKVSLEALFLERTRGVVS